MKKTILKSLAIFAMALLLAGSAMATKKVVFVWDPDKMTDSGGGAGIAGDHPSQINVNLIVEKLGYEVTILTNRNITLYNADEMALINGADLIILDRGIGSANWVNGGASGGTGPGPTAWNAVETPILLMNPYGGRFSQLAWFDNSNIHGIGAADQDLTVKVLKKTDPIFAGITLDNNDNFVLWTGGAEGLEVDPTVSDGGEHLIVFERAAPNLPLTGLTRFKAGVPFYQGGRTPAGPRTYFAFGRDSGGRFPYNYFGFTEEGQTVYIREVERLANLKTSVEKPEKQINVRVYPNPTTNILNVNMNNLKKAEIWDVTGKLIHSFDSNGFEVRADISSLTRGIYFVKAIDNDNRSVVRRIVKN